MDVELTIKNYRCFPDSHPVKVILRKGFTAFVGPNNSGKSSLLKFFFEFRPMFEELASASQLLQALNGQGAAYTNHVSVVDRDEVFYNGNDRPLGIELQVREASSDRTKEGVVSVAKITITVRRSTTTFDLQIPGFPTEDVRKGIFNFDGTTLQLGGSRLDLVPYMRAFKALQNTIYIGAFRNAINIGADENYFDTAAGQSFISSWAFSKAGFQKRQNEAIARVTEDIRRILGFKSLDITSSPDNRAINLLVDGRSFKLPEVGSGLSQLILVLGTVAIKRPAYVLIDEPELGLHPSLQLDFLTSVASYNVEGVLFATHSLGLARAAADWVYSVRRMDSSSSLVKQLESTTRLPELLGELSFSGYRELGFKKVLLVEGRTEVKTIQQFLRKCKKDHEIVIVPLGGGQFINGSAEAEMAELKRLSDDVFVLIDSERAAADEALLPDRKAFVDLCGRLKVECHVLQRRAIENYLSERAVKTFGDQFSALAPYQKLNEVNPSWSKNESWKIAQLMEMDELAGTDLGEFLMKLRP